jgi:hypothetical protein
MERKLIPSLVVGSAPRAIRESTNNKKKLNLSIMKTKHVFFAGFLLLLLSLNQAKAQTTAIPDYFVGKWNILVIGTPNGDSKMTFLLERKNGKLTGAVQDSTGKEVTKITQIDEKDKSITAAFTVQSYDVTITLEPVDDDHVKGSLMDMFDAKGTRVKKEN